MYRTRSISSAPRRGVILVVVLALLTLFAIVGLSFLFYADAEAVAARVYREAESRTRPDVEPELLLAYFLNQFIYDADDQNGIYSALRGHSLARTMYGYNDQAPNVVPFNGTGRIPEYPQLHTGITFFDPSSGQPIGTDGKRVPPGQRPPLMDPFDFINYTCFRNADGSLTDFVGPGVGFVHDPERRGPRTLPANQPPNLTDLTLRGPFIGGFNPPYTYPDLNNVFLAAVKAGPTTLTLPNGTTKELPAGTVLLPSFYRPWSSFRGFNANLFEPSFGSLDPSNQNWYDTTKPWLKYLVLRPRPADMGPGFPAPEDAGGDIKNLIGGPGYWDPDNKRLCNNDSIWIDLDAPVLTTPDGKKYKALFAPLIVDLDGRVNLNVHGNVRGKDGAHVSNQGWGPWEVNLGRILNGGNDPTKNLEWQNLFLGNARSPAANRIQGRYGPERQPETPGAVGRPGNAPPFYAQVDYDGCNEKDFSPTDRLQLPGGANASPLSFFPFFPAGYGNGSQTERTNHPLLYNYFQPASGHRSFDVSNLEPLLRKGDTGSEAMTSDLLRLCPVNFADEKIRRLVTTHSFDLDRPGIMPSARPGKARFTNQVFPYGDNYAGTGFATLAFGDSLAPDDPRNVGEFGPDGRANDAILGRVDLNRRLPDYPAPDATGRFNLADPAVQRQFLAAQSARQRLAQDVFDRLRVAVTGVSVNPNGSLPPIQPPSSKSTQNQFDAHRALAQLAVNVVDFIDSDDVMTPFNWFPTPYKDFSGNNHPGGDWVFGTELPRVVLNEVYAEVTNNPDDPGLKKAVPEATSVLYKFWVELNNPFVPDSIRPDSGVARLQVPASGGESAYPVYHLAIAGPQGSGGPITQAPAAAPEPSLPNVEDVLSPGKPNVMVSDFSPEPSAPPPLPGVDVNVIKPSATSLPDAYNGTVATNANGFYVLGPKDDFPGTAPKAPFATLRVQAKPAGNLTSPNGMSYQAPISTIQPFFSPFGSHPLIGFLVPPQALALRRLTCPGLKPQPDPRKLFYNPYVTVDGMNVPETLLNTTTGRLDSLGVNFALNLFGSTPINPVLVRMENRSALGRTQPYAGNTFDFLPQNPTPPLPGQPKHTFFRHNGEKAVFTPNPNGTLNTPFLWIPHLDRQLVSLVELLNVSKVPPWQFTTGIRSTRGLRNGVSEFNFDYRAGHRTFCAGDTGLFRALEFLECGSRAAGVAPGGRVPGKINVNTIWDHEIFLALCDPQKSSFYGEGDLYRPLGKPGTTDPNFDDPKNPKTLFWRMMATKLAHDFSFQFPSINPDLRGLAGPTGKDRPFVGFGAPIVQQGDGDFNTRKMYPNGSGVQDTLFRIVGDNGIGQDVSLILEPLIPSDPNDPRKHPYVKGQLLNKIASQVTTRSNVFAVWLTVGFFEVTDDTARPVKLGAEVGRSEGRHVRHRMFAIVDRSNLTLTGKPPLFLRANSPVELPVLIGKQASTGATVSAEATVVVDALSGTYDGVPWSIQKGTRLLVDVGANQETVTVTNTAVDQSTSPPTFTLTAVFTKSHPEGFLLADPDAPLGNPGPKRRYDPRSEPHVVRYRSIID